MFQSNELILAALAVTLILIKFKLTSRIPRKPSSYAHIWDFYRQCDLLFLNMEETIVFLDTSHCQIDDDVHVIVERFVNDLKEIQDYIRDCTLSLVPRTNNNHLDSFEADLKTRIEGLYTTLCNSHTCNGCIRN